MWFLFAFLGSWIDAFYYLCNQKSRLTTDVFIIYRGFIPALIATPLMLFYHYAFSWEFYLIVLFQGLVISYMDRKYFEAFHKFGAENVNSIQPLTVIITFILWLLIEPQIVLIYLSNPCRSMVIVLSIGAIVFSVIKYRHHATGLNCFKYVFPLLILSSIMDMSNKVIMNYADSHLIVASIYRVALTGWIIGFVNLFNNRKKAEINLCIFRPENLYKGSFIFLLVLSMVILNLSMYYTLHPAYCTAVLYLSVVWIVLINQIQQWRGRKIIYQNVDKKWIFLLLIATIVLVLATN